MIVVNLQQIGPVPHKFCSREELAAILETADLIMADTLYEDLTTILEEWETALTWASFEPTPVKVDATARKKADRSKPWESGYSSLEDL
jgi:hypothetical protein